MPVTVLTDKNYRPPELSIAHARRVLNRRIEQLHRQNGVSIRSNLDIQDAKELIQRLTRLTSQGTDHIDHIQGDELISAMANWHDPTPLGNYLVPRSYEYRRDFEHHGVYVIIEWTNVGWIPRYVEAIPVYVGMASNLSTRIRMHASGRSSNPAEHVTREYLENASAQEREIYAVAEDAEKQKIRAACIANRNMWVKTAHVDGDLLDVFQLEKALIRQYESQGFWLWNKIKYVTNPPTPSI